MTLTFMDAIIAWALAIEKQIPQILNLYSVRNLNGTVRTVGVSPN